MVRKKTLSTLDCSHGLHDGLFRTQNCHLGIDFLFLYLLKVKIQGHVSDVIFSKEKLNQNE